MTLTYRQTLPSVLEPVAPGMGDRNVSFLREEFVTVDPEIFLTIKHVVYDDFETVHL